MGQLAARDIGLLNNSRNKFYAIDRIRHIRKHLLNRRVDNY